LIFGFGTGVMPTSFVAFDFGEVAAVAFGADFLEADDAERDAAMVAKGYHRCDLGRAIDAARAPDQRAGAITDTIFGINFIIAYAPHPTL
jgi:hypothetical protein